MKYGIQNTYFSDHNKAIFVNRLYWHLFISNYRCWLLGKFTMGSDASSVKSFQSRLRARVVRYNDYNSYPSLVNSLFESLLKCKIDNDWEKLYDSIHHVNILYFHELGYMVMWYSSKSSIFKFYLILHTGLEGEYWPSLYSNWLLLLYREVP